MLGKIKRYFERKIINYRYKKTKDLVIAFDSDDWGSSATNSLSAVERAEKFGFDMRSAPFIHIDSLESERDVQDLSDVLLSFQDKDGHHPIFTLNYMMFNPNLEKMKNDNFSTYYFSSLTDTPSFDIKTLGRIKELIGQCFEVELHGAEHLDVLSYLKEATADPETFSNLAQCGLYQSGDQFTKSHPFGVSDELRCSNEDETSFAIDRLTMAKAAFSSTFSKNSETLTPSCGVLPYRLIKKLPKIEIRKIKTSFLYYDVRSNGKLAKHIAFRKRRHNVAFLIRNARFEPSFTPDAFKKVVSDIDYCSKHHVPCIICSHRLNYVGGSSASTKEFSLKELRHLLSYILLNYPNVKFLSTDDIYKTYF
jgi:hypothetical protein